MDTPAVSVVLPVRDAEATVEAAVRTVLAERTVPLELLAIDDGSKDGTAACLMRLAREDARVRLLQGEGRGLVSALNLGLLHCRAPLLARMDADDECVPGRLGASLERLSSDPSLWGVGTQVELFREDRPVSPAMQAYARWLNGLTSAARLRLERFIESPLCHPSVMLRTERLRALGGWRDGDFPEDYELWLRILSSGGELCTLSRVGLRWRDHEGRLTRTDPRYGRERFLALKARYLAKDVLTQGRCAIWGAGTTGLRLMRALRAEGVEVPLLFELSPGKVGQRIEGARVVRPEEMPPPGTLHVLAAVGAAGAREEIRAFLAGRDYAEGTHFTCVA